MMHSPSLKNTAKIVFVNGLFNAALSDLTAVPAEAALVFSGSDYSLHLPAESALLLVEEHQGESSAQHRSERQAQITLARGAVLDYLQWQNLPYTAAQQTVFSVTQAAGSRLRAGFFAGGALSDHQQVRVHQQGEYAETELYGFCQPARDHQHLAHTAEVLHDAPHGKSSMIYKGILDAGSKASFRGRVKVTPAGKGVGAHQGTHWLLLSKNAEASALPELEIDQEDISCSHGATVGQLDDEALFYLTSRGISRDEAGQMLRRAFLQDVFDRVPSALLPWISAKLGYAHE